MTSAISQSSDVIEALRRMLGALPVGDSTERAADNLAVVRQLGARAHVAGMIRAILDTPSLTREVAARSYRHINLFDKIVLVDGDDARSYRLTLHLWRPPYSAPEMRQELIHEHRFDFWSLVLVGTLVSDNFTPAPAGTLYHQYRYVPERGRSVQFSDFYEYCGDVALALSGRGQRTAGEAYHLRAPTIHRIVLPQRDMVCTLVLRGPRLRDYSYVYNTAYPRGDAAFANAMFSPAELSVRLSALAVRLEDPASA